MAGAGAGSFGAGFARGLANVLLHNRQEQTRKRERQEEVDYRNFQSTLPIIFQNFQQNPTPEGAAALEDMLVRFNPDLKQQIKRSGFSFESLGPMLSKMEPAQPGYTEAIEGVPGATRQVPATPAQQTLPATSGAMVGMPDQQTRLFGQTVLSPSELKSRDVEVDYNAKVAFAQKLSRTAGIPLSEAMDRVGLRSSTASMTPPQPGSTAAQVMQKNAERVANGQPVMSQAETQAFVEQVERGQATAQRGHGVNREAIAQGMFHKAYAELGQPEQLAVLDAEQKYYSETAENRALGAGLGRFQSPIDIKTSQETGVQVGTTAEQLAGQQVPTQDVNARRRSLTVLKGDIGRVQELIEVLPSEKELAGIAPGGVMAVRKRMNTPSNIIDPATKQPMSYRAAYAQLQSVVDQMVNVLARARGESVGTQTERDAERAYNAVVQLQAGLLDPFGGDTRESAAARLTEALSGLDRVIEGLPAAPVPRQPGATPAAGKPTSAQPAQTAPAGPAGITMRNGILYGPDGKPLPGQGQ